MMVLDVNILLYAHNDQAQFHVVCREWLEAALVGTRPVGLPLITAMGFLRIITNPRVMAPPVPLDAALDALEVIRRAPPVEEVVPADGHWVRVRREALDVQATGPALTDVHLAVLAKERGAALVTHDRGFRRFAELLTIDPTEA